MPRYAAFLRAINVGGRRISSADLAGHFEAIGFEGATCFRASGNVIVDAPGGSAAAHTKRIEQGLERALGYEVVTFLRSANQVHAIAAAQPFKPAELKRSTGKLQVVLLLKKPPAATRKKALALATDDDRLAFGDRELFWLPKGGMADSELDLKAVGRLLGVNTVRTMGTVEQIAAKYF